jgi:glycosyltransferase involved in cell wall biosynthesis
LLLLLLPPRQHPSSDEHVNRLCVVEPFAYPVLANRDVGFAGGAEIQLVLCARALRDKGYQVSMIVGDFGQPAVEVFDGIEAHRCPMRYLSGGPRRTFLPDSASLLATLRRIGAPLVLTANPQNLLATLALHRWSSRSKLVKVVVSTSDVEVVSGALAGRLYRLGLKGTDQAVFQTEEQAVKGRRNFGMRGRVIPTFVPGGAAQAEDGVRDIDVLWVGGCDANKRPELLLDVAEALPHARFVMVSAPRGDLKRYAEIQDRAAALPNVEHLGFVLEEDSSQPFWNQLMAYHRRTRLLVSTSLREGFPNVFLEAWSAGAPVVSLNVDPDGIIERHGLGCLSGTMEQLTADVAALLGDEEGRAALAANGRAYVAQTHATEVVVQKYLELFDDLEGRTG